MGKQQKHDKVRTARPTVDVVAVRERLGRAREQQLYVHVKSWISGADRIAGFVVGVSTEWVVFQQLAYDMSWDGWIFTRVENVRAITTDPDRDCFEVRAAKARGVWPPAVPAADLTSAAGVLRSASRLSVMVGINDEHDRPDARFIGAVRSVDDGVLHLLEVNTRGGWSRRTRTFDPADVTRVDVGDGYQETLLLVAGPTPSGV